MRRPIAAVALIAIALALVGCRAATPATTAAKEKPATVELVAGQEKLHRITLTQKAADRLAIQTVEVAQTSGSSGRSRIPYSSIIYDAQGGAWAYVVDGAPLVFVRQAITVDDIVADAAGDYAILTKGPPPGRSVVSVGVAELFGAEFEVGH
jgi:hypothetical protein